MKKTAVLRGDPQGNEVLTMPVAHDPRRARLVRRAHLKVADCSGIRSAAFRSIAALEAGIRKARGTQSLGIDAADRALIEAISRGDRHAMALLYARHHLRVYRFALRISGDATLAEDIVG